jgi:hypothetical protein
MNVIIFFSDRSSPIAFAMSSLEPITYTVHLKEPVRRADDTIGLTVYLNDQVEDHYCPQFYRKFMSSVYAAESDASSSSSSSVAAATRQSDMKMFRRVYRKSVYNCTYMPSGFVVSTTHMTYVFDITFFSFLTT